jgi:hypothetical protein
VSEGGGLKYPLLLFIIIPHNPFYHGDFAEVREPVGENLVFLAEAGDLRAFFCQGRGIFRRRRDAGGGIPLFRAEELDAVREDPSGGKGTTLHRTDNGFVRFPALRWKTPLSTAYRKLQADISDYHDT